MTMTRDKIEELKRLAEKATPGPWKIESTFQTVTDEKGRIVSGIVNVHYAAAADPTTILSLLALAERALEPQGQALPVSADPNFDGYERRKAIQEGEQNAASDAYFGARTHLMDTTANRNIYRAGFNRGYEIAQEERASQLALPAGPVPEGFVLVPMHLNTEMRDVLSEEDWTWEDLLVAANAVTEEQYYAIQSGDDGSPAVAQPVCQTCGDQGDVYVVKHEGELPSHDLAPCPDCTKSVAHPVAEGCKQDSEGCKGCGQGCKQPVADEREKAFAKLVKALETAKQYGGAHWYQELREFVDEALECAALCQPAEEGDKA